jgi:phosphoglycolate phosphatase-like HAD superfamily hydrolase
MATCGRCRDRSRGSTACAAKASGSACWPSGERVAAALELAGIADRFDVVVTGSHLEQLVAGALDQLNVEADRAVVVGVEPSALEAARAAGVVLAIGVARGNCSPEQLRRAGADAVVADLQELLGPT